MASSKNMTLRHVLIAACMMSVRFPTIPVDYTCKTSRTCLVDW
jgi:hypothetical protein